MNEHRRTFLKKIGRAAILTGLLGVSADLLFRRREEALHCDYDFICRNCKKNRSCHLPEGRAFQQGMKQKPKDHGQE